MGELTHIRAGRGPHGLTVHNAQPAPRKRRPPDPALHVRRPDPQVWATALSLAGGDPKRLDVQADGSVIVRNNPRK
jgi:hypothetical protein